MVSLSIELFQPWDGMVSLSFQDDDVDDGYYYYHYESYEYNFPQTPRIAHTPSMLYTWGYQTVDFTLNWEDQQGYLGNINFPPPLNFTFIEDLQ